MNVSWAELGWDAGTRAAVRDIWAHEDRGVFSGGYTAVDIACSDVAFLRISTTVAVADGTRHSIVPGK